MIGNSMTSSVLGTREVGQNGPKLEQDEPVCPCGETLLPFDNNHDGTSHNDSLVVKSVTWMTCTVQNSRVENKVFGCEGRGSTEQLLLDGS